MRQNVGVWSLGSARNAQTVGEKGPRNICIHYFLKYRLVWWCLVVYISDMKTACCTWVHQHNMTQTCVSARTMWEIFRSLSSVTGAWLQKFATRALVMSNSDTGQLQARSCPDPTYSAACVWLAVCTAVNVFHRKLRQLFLVKHFTAFTSGPLKQRGLLQTVASMLKNITWLKTSL